MFDTHPTRTMPHHSANALASADFAKTQTHSAKTALFHRFSPNWSALWRPNSVKSRLCRHQSGGIALHEGATRRRHAARGLRVVQNPRHHRCGGCWRDRRAWLRCPWAVVGPGRAPRRNDETMARQISHAIPPRHDPTQAQKPQNINDRISKPEILSGELHAKLPRCSQDSRHTTTRPRSLGSSGCSEGLAAVPVGGGGAWLGFEATRRAEGSRRGRLAGGPPPTGTQSSPARTQQRARSAAAPRAPRVSAHRLSWMLRPGTASISSRV